MMCIFRREGRLTEKLQSKNIEKTGVGMTSRDKKISRQLVLVAAIAALTSCADPVSDRPVYEASDCRRIGLVDIGSGELVVGAEDIAVDFVRDRIFVSAYDRRAAETAARKKDFSIPQGGLYAIDLKTLRSAGDRLISVRSLVDRSEIPGGLRPHGIDYDASVQELTFVNRGYQMINREWRMAPRLERVGVNGELFVGTTKPTPCAANDVLAFGANTLVTFDRASCGASGVFETIFGIKRSGIADQDGEVVFDGVLFANGLATDDTGRIAVAATREKSIHFLDASVSTMKHAKKLTVAGGPDNLSVTEDGRIIAAVHPSMLKLAAHRKLGIGRAPSRIIEISTDDHSVTALFDDPGGKHFSAATIGVKVDDTLILGSATDTGLLVCERTNEKAEEDRAIAANSFKQVTK